jgi:acetoin utilization deacetylase AcuC-like enzyme
MSTLIASHPAALLHINPPGHPESTDRFKAVQRILATPPFRALERIEAPLATREQLLLAHAEDYTNLLLDSSPEQGWDRLDPDTYMSPSTLEAALRAVGAGIVATDAVFSGAVSNAFCAMRPPGHHAESRRAMGFCLFNTAAIAALHARHAYGVERVAVVDFDVHHGNGTQEIFWPDADLFYGSTHQMPLYPGTGARNETGVGNIVNAPLRAGDGSEEFREAMDTVILPALDAFAPDFVVISAGFDAHRDDPLGSLELTERDFSWATLKIMELADNHAGSRVVSVLEGGYDLEALANSAAAHVSCLMHGQDFEDDDEQ